MYIKGVLTMITNKTSLLLVTLLLGCSAVAFAGPTDEQAAEFHKSGLNNAGVAANRAIEYMERQRVAKQIAEDKAKAENEVLRREAAALREQLAKERRRESRREERAEQAAAEQAAAEKQG